MKLPVVCGIIDRRILLNYRVDPELLVNVLPRPFRPQLVRGSAIAGICLIRLKQIRPRYLPPAAGLTSENAAYRIAVEWDEDGATRTGVFIPRRDTSSVCNVLLGGRLFPGVHHRARFRCEERGDHYRVRLDSLDGATHVSVEGRVAERLPETSVFASIEEASAFFQQGSLGYSPTKRAHEFEGLELCASAWHLTPLHISVHESSFFHNAALFPHASVEFDSALLMRSVPHQWRVLPTMRSQDYSPLQPVESIVF